MIRGVLDTSVLIGEDPADLPEELGISIASLCELHYGVLVARDEAARARRLTRLNLINRRFDPLPVNEAVADSYAVLAARVTAIGRQPRARVLDLLVAATARTHQARLYTRNPDDLRGLEGLLEVVSV